LGERVFGMIVLRQMLLEIHVNTIRGLGRTGGEEGFLVVDHCIKVHDAVRLIGKVYGSLHQDQAGV
jgi:hypothetical protein